MPSVSIDVKFRGPTGSANGGYTCGLLASFLHGPAEVTLTRPPPLERPLEVVTEGSLELRDGEQLVAQAEPAELNLDVPDPIPFEEAAAAELPDGDRNSVFPECFVCGWRREDGLRIYAGPGRGREARRRDVGARRGRDLVRVRLGGARLPRRVRGRVRSARKPRPRPPDRAGSSTSRIQGERCVVIGWPLGEEGRKLYAGTALPSARTGGCSAPPAPPGSSRPIST